VTLTPPQDQPEQEHWTATPVAAEYALLLEAGRLRHLAIAMQQRSAIARVAATWLQSEAKAQIGDAHRLTGRRVGTNQSLNERSHSAVMTGEETSARLPVPPELVMTPSGRQAAELFGALVELHHECMSAGSPEAAYHALAAALHCAESASLVSGIRTVITLADSRQGELDTQMPPHILSTRLAASRGTVPLFTSLARTAQAVGARLAAERARSQSAQRQRRLYQAARGADEDAADPPGEDTPS